MRIAPVSYINISNNHSVAKSKPIFTAHPDFYDYNSTASCWFRRGSVLLACAKGYKDIEQVLYKILSKNINTVKQMLIIGIGDSQEPCSYLTSSKGILKNNLLIRNLDLYTVDLQSKPEHIDLKKNTFCDLYDYQSFPKFAKDGFVKDSTKNWLEIKEEDDALRPIEKFVKIFLSVRDKWEELKDKGYSLDAVIKMAEEEKKQKSMRWRINDEIFEFLESTYNNPQKSKWDSRIQDVVLEFPNNKFNIIAANNVLPYIISEPQISQTVKHIIRILRPKGYLITDPYNFPYHIKEIHKYYNMKEIYPGIYQKIK